MLFDQKLQLESFSLVSIPFFSRILIIFDFFYTYLGLKIIGKPNQLSSHL